MVLTAEKIQNSEAKRKKIINRERRIEAEIMRLEIQPSEIRQFCTVCECLDCFVWKSQLVDLRPIGRVK